jgi:hypothetical protein
MANDNIIKFTELSEKVNKVLSTQIGILDGAATNLEALNTAYGKLPSEYFNAIKQGLEIEKKKAQVDKELITLEKKKSQVIKSKIPTLRQLTNFHNAETKAIEKANREREKEQRLLNKTTGLYNKVQAGINSLTKQYNDLALRKELNGKLSDSEVVTLGRLEAKLNKYQGALKRVDANIGKHQRNVGNYKSSFDGLGFSVAQLSREMPAFANSMQTGFMAISNNIPMLVDEINKLKRANIELSASGKPTVSVFKSLGKAIFGWQTLISIGVTLLTVYGAKIFETIFAISEEEKALKEANKQIEEQNKALRENIRLRERSLESTRNFINSSGNLDVFREVLNDLTKDSSKAEAVLAELSERLSKIGVTDAKLLKDTNILASDRMVIASNLLAIEENKVKLEKERQRLNTVALEKEQILKDFEDGKISTSVKNIKLQSLQTQSLNKTISLQKEIKRLNEANQQIIGKTIEIESESNKKGGKREKEVSVLKDISKGHESYRLEVEKLIKELETLQSVEIKGTKVYEDLASTIEALKKSLNPFEGMADAGISELDEWSKAFSKQQKFILDTQKEFTKKREDLERDLSNNLKELALSVSDAIFQTELNRLDEQSRINQARAEEALVFANGNAAAEERIKQQLADKEAAIEEKRIKTEKKAFLFNQAFRLGEVAIDTFKSVASIKAQAAILAANPVTLPLAPLALAQIPLVITSGAIAGAAIAAQSVPAFKKGVRDFEGGAAIVGDGGVSEIVRTKNGVFATPNKDTLVNLPKGADVFSSHDEYFNNVMGDLGILPSIPKVNVVNNGLTKVDLDQVMSKHFSNIQTNQTVIDKNGLNTYVKKQNSKTTSLNNRVSFKGFSV